MKYSEIIEFNPITKVIQLRDADNDAKAKELVSSYVMSDNMAEKLEANLLSQLNLEDVVDNKGVFLVGNYGTGKSHLMSVISTIANKRDYLQYVQNEKFREASKIIAGKFEVLRIELGSVQTPLRKIIFEKVKEDFKKRDIDFTYPSDTEISENKSTILNMMELFAEKYSDAGYLIVVDEFLDFLRIKKDLEIRRDLAFLREVGEVVKNSRLRIILGVQEKLFENPKFSFVSETLKHIKDRFEQVTIQKEDTEYVVSERILKKTNEQKAAIREHLSHFTSLYTNMSEKLEEYVSLYPIHPSYIAVFNSILVAENREILTTISNLVGQLLASEIPDNKPGILSFDTYWSFIKGDATLKSDENIKEVVFKSEKLESIISHSFQKKQYKDLALQIIYALSVYRLTTVDISIPTGLTTENLKDDLCLYIPNLPDKNSETLLSIISVILREILKTVSGQFIEHNEENDQYYLDLKKDIDYDENIRQKAESLSWDVLNRYFKDVVFSCLNWDVSPYRTGFDIYEHSLNWASHNIYRKGYLFLGTPENRTTAQPPEDYYVYFIPPYDNEYWKDNKETDSVYFIFKQTEEFTESLKLYAAAVEKSNVTDSKNKAVYLEKGNGFKKKLTKYLSENKYSLFDVRYLGVTKSLIEVMNSRNKAEMPFKETIDFAASICLEEYFQSKYPNIPKFKIQITQTNLKDIVRSGIEFYAGRQKKQALELLESFNLIDDGKISVENSAYAKYFIGLMKKQSANSVINFSDICYKELNEEWLDKNFKINTSLLSIVLLALVHNGYAELTIKTGKSITPSNLDDLIKIDSTDVEEFKHLSKPKGIPVAELTKFYEILGLPTGLITNEKEREKGLEQFLKVTQDLAERAARSSSKLTDEFKLWGEPLLAEHIVSKYKDSLKRISDSFSNFKVKFNTVPKLSKFTYSIDEINQFKEDIDAISIIDELVLFKMNCQSNVDYIKNLECLELGDAFKSDIERSKFSFRSERDRITTEQNGERAANTVNSILSKLKAEYIERYLEEHKKYRLSLSEDKKKSKLMSSPKYQALKKLKQFDSICSVSKFESIETILASELKTCYELTEDELQEHYVCKHCNYQLGSKEKPVLGGLEKVEDAIDTLYDEWARTLINALTDPTLEKQISFLDKDKQKVVTTFISSKAFPETVDQFFVSALEDALKGFDVVEIDTDEFVSELQSLGATTKKQFKDKFDAILTRYTSGKDMNTLRLILK